LKHGQTVNFEVCTKVSIRSLDEGICLGTAFSMSDQIEMDWCRTWSIHPVFAISPPTEATADDSATSRHCARSSVSIESSSTEELEQDATLHFRRYGCMKQARKRLRTSSTRNDRDDFVRVLWIPPRNEDATTSQQHLYVEVWMRNAFSAAVTFCDWNNRSFEFCLARGLRSSYEAMFGWLATISDAHVGMVPFCPRSEDLANTVAAWISAEYHGKTSKSIGSKTDGGEAKPMTLTFATPRPIAEAGLDTISLTVPPQALWKLYNSLCQCQNVRTDAIAVHDSDGDDSSREEPLPLPPIVRAMQCYFLEAFAIDIAAFPLTKVVTSSATLGADGRYKPSEGSAVGTPSSLSAIRQMVNASKASVERHSDAI
jgi:Kinetochore complex Sim4 subunit Fta1